MQFLVFVLESLSLQIVMLQCGTKNSEAAEVGVVGGVWVGLLCTSSVVSTRGLGLHNETRTQSVQRVHYPPTTEFFIFF